MHQQGRYQDLPPDQPQHRGDQGALQTISWQDQGPTCLHQPDPPLDQAVHEGKRGELLDESIVSDLHVILPLQLQFKFPERSTYVRRNQQGQRMPDSMDLKRTPWRKERSSVGPPYTTIYQLVIYVSITYICTLIPMFTLPIIFR